MLQALDTFRLLLLDLLLRLLLFQSRLVVQPLEQLLAAEAAGRVALRPARCVVPRRTVFELVLQGVEREATVVTQRVLRGLAMVQRF